MEEKRTHGGAEQWARVPPPHFCPSSFSNQAGSGVGAALASQMGRLCFPLSLKKSVFNDRQDLEVGSDVGQLLVASWDPGLCD